MCCRGDLDLRSCVRVASKRRPFLSPGRGGVESLGYAVQSHDFGMFLGRCPQRAS